MRSRKKAFYKRRTVIVAAALCLLSILGLAGIYRLESNKNKQDKELVNWEEIDDTRQAKGKDSLKESQEKKDTQDENRSGLVNKDEADGQESRLGESAAPTPVPLASAEPSELPVIETPVPQESPVPQPAAEESSEGETAQASVQNAINLNFKPESGMIWPVEGNVILDYSMDHSIYFPTLNQYKYNPAIAIQSETGTPVLSVANGVIESITETDETGLTMTVDLGSGYQAVYGQLAEVSLSTGSYVEAGSQIATVAEPSIYYQVEGDNLYFQVLKDGQPVDPLDYIK
ncbi:MAG: M23 family metallopeptidase [Lachnospiraceae bacterium]|nr:M23 family metallopeptidase [Lachnospiraceae bacterium]